MLKDFLKRSRKTFFTKVFPYRKLPPQNFLDFRDFFIFCDFRGPEVGEFSKKPWFFGVSLTKVRKCSAKQNANQPINISEVEIRSQLSFKKIRSKKSNFYMEKDKKQIGGYTPRRRERVNPPETGGPYRYRLL